MSASDPNRPSTSASTDSNKLKGITKLLKTFGKSIGKKNDEEVKVPQVKHWRASSREITLQEHAAAPNLGDGGWGDKSWQKVRAKHQQDLEPREYVPPASRLSNNSKSMSAQRISDQTRSTSTRALFNFGDRASVSPSPSLANTPQTAQQYPVTPPRRTVSGDTSYTPQNTPPSVRTNTTPSRRTPSVSSGASSLRSQANITTHRTPSGSSYTSQGVNVRALPKPRTASGGGSPYTKQGLRVGSDGYVGKWKDPKKEAESGVWKGHPALQPRPS
jgi:hypothetical protein